MANNKLLSLNECIIIRDSLKDKHSYQQIASLINKDGTAVYKEIKK